MLDIDKKVVSKYYIECELDNIITGNDIHLREGGYSINQSRLLEALSFTYRANSVFDYIESGNYYWEERSVRPDEILLTGMSENLTPIIYSPEIQQNPVKFVDYIKSHSDDDRFNELQARSIPENRKTLILRQDGNSLKMLDGSHRFLSMVMSGVKSMNAYIATPTVNNTRPVIGDAIFLRLRKLWQHTEDPLFKASIENTIIGMIRATANGERSVHAYWVRMAPNAKVKAVGEQLIIKSKLTDRSL